MATSALSFWIPVRYEYCTLLGTIDDYFHIKGDVAIVDDSSDKVQLKQTESSLWLTVVKIISYATLIIPAIALVIKWVLRTQYRFHIAEQNESEIHIYHSKSTNSFSKRTKHKIPSKNLPNTFQKLLRQAGANFPPAASPHRRIPVEPVLPSSLQELLREVEANPPPLPSLEVNLPHDFQSTAELLRESEDFYNNYALAPALTFDTIDISKLTIQGLIRSLLNQYNGLCIGESHNDSSPKFFLYSNMALFRELGVDVIYIEGYKGLQGELDLYTLETTLEMPERLKKRVSRMDSTGLGGYTEYDVLEACKEEGIRIVNIDSDAAYDAPVLNEKNIAGIKRASAMNYQAKLIMDKDRMHHKPRKCLIYAGVAHTSSIAGIPGLGQIYQIPTLAIEDSPLNTHNGANRTTIPSYTIEKNKVHMSRKRTMHTDFYVRMHKPLK
jgi:hypothetical protein